MQGLVLIPLLIGLSDPIEVKPGAFRASGSTRFDLKLDFNSLSNDPSPLGHSPVLGRFLLP